METKFNFKSQVCTSREQSKRLLALGLKKETADMHRFYTGKIHGWQCSVQCYQDAIAEPFRKEDATNGNIQPAWSLGRLVEMMPNLIHNKRILAYLTIKNDRVLYDTIKNETYSAFTNNNGLFAAVVDAVEWLIKEGYFPKEYLE